MAFTAGGIFMSSGTPVDDLRSSRGHAAAADQLLVVAAVADLAGGLLLWRLSNIMAAQEKLLLSHTTLQKQAKNMEASSPSPPCRAHEEPLCVRGDSRTGCCGVLGPRA
jgi:hypothetical protein